MLTYPPFAIVDACRKLCLAIHTHICAEVSKPCYCFLSFSNSSRQNFTLEVSLCRYLSDFDNKTKLLQYDIDNKKDTHQSMIMFGAEIMVRWCCFLPHLVWAKYF